MAQAQDETPNEQPNETPKVDISEAQWEDDFSSEDLTIPYKNEEAEEDSVETPEDKEPEDTKENVPEEVKVAPVDAKEVEDPGEYTPSDYSFDFNIDGKSYKITTADDIDKIDDDELAKLSAKDLTKLIRQSAQIEDKQERDKREYDDKKSKFDEVTESVQAQQEVIQNIANEFELLVSRGLIPAIADEFKTANWRDTKISDQEGVKEQLAILDFMSKENEDRAKFNVKPMTSVIEAFNGWKATQEKVDKEAQAQANKQARKDAGSRVASSTNNQSGSITPKGIAVGKTNAFSTNNASNWE